MSILKRSTPRPSEAACCGAARHDRRYVEKYEPEHGNAAYLMDVLRVAHDRLVQGCAPSPAARQEADAGSAKVTLIRLSRRSIGGVQTYYPQDGDEDNFSAERLRAEACRRPSCLAQGADGRLYYTTQAEQRAEARTRARSSLQESYEAAKVVPAFLAAIDPASLEETLLAEHVQYAALFPMHGLSAGGEAHFLAHAAASGELHWLAPDGSVLARRSLGAEELNFQGPLRLDLAREPDTGAPVLHLADLGRGSVRSFSLGENPGELTPTRELAHPALAQATALCQLPGGGLLAPLWRRNQLLLLDQRTGQGRLLCDASTIGPHLAARLPDSEAVLVSHFFDLQKRIAVSRFVDPPRTEEQNPRPVLTGRVGLGLLVPSALAGVRLNGGPGLAVGRHFGLGLMTVA